MTTLNVGLLGLDTSHAEAFAGILSAEPSVTISTVWDGGDVRDREYADRFCERYDAVSCEDPAAMLGAVDAVMVLTANWDTHRSLAVPFLDAGVPTFVDKPLAGKLEDVEAIADAAGPTPLMGGSAIPCHPALNEVPVGLSERWLYCVGYDHPYYYGVHLADTARVLADADWNTVAPSEEPGDTATVAFENGTHATLRLDGPADDGSFGLLDIGNRIRAEVLRSDERSRKAMYSRFVGEFLDTVRGGRNDTSRLVDGATLLLAVHAALSADERITPASNELRTVHADGETFLRSYSPYY